MIYANETINAVITMLIKNNYKNFVFFLNSGLLLSVFCSRCQSGIYRKSVASVGQTKLPMFLENGT